jgi:hypothetical protein
MNGEDFIQILKEKFGYGKVESLPVKEKQKLTVAGISEAVKKREIEKFLKEEFPRIALEHNVEVTPIYKKPGRAESIDFALKHNLTGILIAEVSLRAASGGMGASHTVAFFPKAEKREPGPKRR